MLEKVLRSGAKVSQRHESSPSQDSALERDADAAEGDTPEAHKGSAVYSPSRYSYQGKKILAGAALQTSLPPPSVDAAVPEEIP
ncbi:hypothetical protein DUI87_24456 [Hirundo rustica rustica]|uniref:Uncharacterized protein n=1 Tax=Hirundo rustica rustica TaxID=333673 RepID=A0A3M0JD08_HIRRU|nr:hypothetical protein DUI87_24456 [Hirundo rustica rustica]